MKITGLLLTSVFLSSLPFWVGAIPAQWGNVNVLHAGIVPNSRAEIPTINNPPSQTESVYPAVLTPEGGGPPGGNVQAIAIDPVSSGTVYTGTNVAGIFLSTDGGVSWTSANAGLTSKSINALAINPVNPAILYAGTSTGVFRSLNAGVSWASSSSGLPSGSVADLAIDPLNPATLYAATTGGVFKTSNGGANWVAANSGLTSLSLQVLAINPVTPSTLYAGTFDFLGGMIFKTTNGGANWTPASTGISGFFTVDALAVDPSNPATLYYGGNRGVYKSTNGAASWTQTGPGFGSQVYALAIDPANPATVYAGGGIFPASGLLAKSTDGGASWTNTSSGLTPGTILSLGLDPLRPATLYAGTFDDGIFKSVNGASLWRAASNGLAASRIAALAVDPTNSAILFAARGTGVFKSTNAGAVWTDSGIQTFNLASLVVDPANPATIYAASFNGVFKSTDRATSWRAVFRDASVQALAMDPTTPATLYAATQNSGVYKTTDAGASWAPMSAGLPDLNVCGINVCAIAIDPVTPATVYVGLDSAGNHGAAVYKSTNGGGNWSPARTGLPTSGAVTALAIHPSNPALIFAGTGTGVFRSLDGGTSWSSVNSGLTNLSVQDLILDPANPAILYAATLGGVFKSPNGGGSWFGASSGLTNLDIFSLAIGPQSPSILYAGSRGAGVFLSSDGAASWQLTTAIAVNPAPSISSLSPSSSIAGIPALAMTVNGANFLTSSVVRWNGSDRGTTFISDHQLTAFLPPADLATVGTASVTVFNPEPGGGTTTTLTFTITGPAISLGGTVNGASFRPASDPNGAIAPGALVAIFGTDLASREETASTVPLPITLADTSVTFDGIAAPLFFVSQSQINAQVPFEVAPGIVSVVVKKGGIQSVAQRVTVAAFSPGIFTVNRQGTGAGAILHADSFRFVTVTDPARPGEYIALFCTGLGQLRSPAPTGAISPIPPPETLSLPQATIAGLPASVSYSGLAPGFVGLYQVNLQIPVSVPSGTTLLQLIMNGVPSNTVTLAVQ